METIEPKERERIEQEGKLFLGDQFLKWWRLGAETEHLHLTNRVIEPLRKRQDQLLSKIRQLEYLIKFGFKEGTPQQHNANRIIKLEAENKELHENLKSLQSQAQCLIDIGKGCTPKEFKEVMDGLGMLLNALPTTNQK